MLTRSQKRYIKHKDSINKDNLERYRKTIADPVKLLDLRDKIRMRRYGMTREAYDAMLAGQGLACAICKNKFLSFSGKNVINIDHCHSTGTVRGLLCKSCNIALGLLKDSVDTAKNLLEYLTRFNC